MWSMASEPGPRLFTASRLTHAKEKESEASVKHVGVGVGVEVYEQSEQEMRQPLTTITALNKVTLSYQTFEFQTCWMYNDCHWSFSWQELTCDESSFRFTCTMSFGHLQLFTKRLHPPFLYKFTVKTKLTIILMTRQVYVTMHFTANVSSLNDGKELPVK